MVKYLKNKPGSIEETVANLTAKVNESEYQKIFKKELEKAGKGIGSMTPKEKKNFFNKIDSMYSAKNEKVDNPYAVGMAAAMKAKGDTPPLKKSTITKAHDIADKIKKDQKEETMIEKAVKEITAAQKKLPPALQKAIAKKEKDNVEETHSFVTNKMNKKQKDADGEEKVITKEADEKGDEINKMKLAKVKKGEKDIVDPEPKLKQESVYNTIRNMWEQAAEKKEEKKKDNIEQKDKAAKDDKIGSLKDQVALLKQKLENEKHRAVKPEPNPETGEVPLTVGVAYKHIADKMKKEAKDPKEIEAEKAKEEKEMKKKKDTLVGTSASKIETEPKVDYNN